MELNKSIIAIALVSALSACGGSGSSSSKATVEPPPAPVPVKTVIEGKAIKGTIANAIVTVYKYVDGIAVKLEGADLETATITTESDGSYTITILDYDGPIKIELSVDENTTMICDAPAGCGGVAYGETIALATVDPTLVLSAISTVGASNDGSANVNVSALTHLAVALIEADDAGVTTESIQTQSSVVASAFNIMGSITELEPTAVDSASAVAGEENADELRYGLINAGIMAALFSGEEDGATAVLSEKLAEVAADLVEHDGALLVNQDENNEGFELSLVEVLDGAGDAASAVAEAIAADSELADTEGAVAALAALEQEETNLENQSEYEESNESENGRSDTEVEVPTEGDAVAKAKAMIDDVRLFSHLFKVGTESNTGITTEGDKYIALINSAGVMVEAEAASFMLLADVTDALSTVSMMYEAGTIEEGTLPIDSYLSTEGAAGTITFAEETTNGGILFTINAVSGDEKVALNAEVTFAEDGLSITLNINGSIESAGAMLSLTEGSLAKVNLDSAITRATLEDDTFEGEITSGELVLEVVLEQKVSDTIIDPVTFTGAINTKLEPVSVPTLSEHWEWNNSTERDELIYGQPEMEIVILPEMLTLSGGFSSSTNLIKATLTVNVQDLESYEAPGFEYIGKKVENLLNIKISADLNTVVLTDADIIVDDRQIVSTATFAKTAAGNWTNAVSLVAEDAELHSWGTGYELSSFSRPFDTELGTGFTYTYAYILGRESNNYYAQSVRATPIDDDSNGVADGYHFELIRTNDGTSLYNTDDMIDDEGNINLSAFVNNNGEILTADGQPRPWNNIQNLNTYLTIDDFVDGNSGYVPVNPFAIDNGAEFFSKTKNSFSRTVDDIGLAEIMLSEDQLENIAAGEVLELNPTAYLIEPLLKEAFTIAVSEDSNTVTLTLENAFTATRTFEGDGEGNYSANTTATHADGSMTADYQTAVATVIEGVDLPKVVVNNAGNWNDWEWANQAQIIPVDLDEDGIADQFTFKAAWGKSFNDSGELLDWEGNVIDLDERNDWVTADSYAQLLEYSADWGNPVAAFFPINPYEASNALDYYKSLIVNRDHSTLGFDVDSIGHVEVSISEEKFATVLANTSINFDAYVTAPDSTESLENEDVFLDASAALTVEAILGDYQVKLILSGQRTAFEDGKFDLEMSYKRPDDESMRKFVAHMQTDEAGTLTVNNSEGVLLIINELEEGADSNVIGTIVVGRTLIKAAEIQDRGDGLITIVYEDEFMETL